MSDEEKTTLSDAEILTVSEGDAVARRAVADTDEDDMDTDADDADADTDTDDPS